MMKALTQLTLIAILACMTVSAAAQEVDRTSAEFTALTNQYQNVPHIDTLVSNVFNTMKVRVRTVQHTVGVDGKPIGEPIVIDRDIIQGRIDKIVYNPIEQSANVHTIRQDYTARMIQTWTFRGESWVQYDPDPSIHITVPKVQ